MITTRQQITSLIRHDEGSPPPFGPFAPCSLLQAKLRVSAEGECGFALAAKSNPRISVSLAWRKRGKEKRWTMRIKLTCPPKTHTATICSSRGAAGGKHAFFFGVQQPSKMKHCKTGF